MENSIATQIVFENFKNNIKRATTLLEELSNEELSQEIVFFKNTGHYLFGHLTATNDNMLTLLGFGESLYPELVEVFIKNPDKSGLDKTPISELRSHWKTINEVLLSKLESLTTEEWFEKHTAVSKEGFVKEPHRNKLNVVLSRTNHLTYHLGQLALLKN